MEKGLRAVAFIILSVLSVVNLSLPAITVPLSPAEGCVQAGEFGKKKLPVLSVASLVSLLA